VGSAIINRSDASRVAVPAIPRRFKPVSDGPRWRAYRDARDAGCDRDARDCHGFTHDARHGCDAAGSVCVNSPFVACVALDAHVAIVVDDAHDILGASDETDAIIAII
jgi:hypothetical protein